jgi:hypothetical protein
MDTNPVIFVLDLQDANQKKFFCLLLSEGTITSFSKIKSHKEGTKQRESRFFLLFLLDDTRRIQIRTSESD